MNQASYITITSLIQNSCPDSDGITYELLIPTLQHLETSIKVSDPTMDSATLATMQDLLCGLLQVIMVKVGNRVDQGLSKQIIELLILLFKQNNRVTEGGLIAYQGMVIGQDNKVDIDSIGKYIVTALESNEELVVKYACGIISDWASVFEQSFSRYLNEFVPHLQNILENQEASQQMKLPAIHALGTLSLYCKESFNRTFLKATMAIFN